jgi:TetR/AcrR family transcriptional repressor of mexJK operon
MPTRNSAKPAKDPAGSETRAEQLTQRLLEAATQVFMAKGFDATSMGEIAALAHASKETFYRHFPTKDELFRAVILRRAEMVARDLGGALATHQPPEKALLAFGEFILTRMMTEDSLAFHRILGMTRERFPDLIQLYRMSGPFRVRDVVCDYLNQQVAKGRLRPMNAQVAARQYFDLMASEMILSAHILGKGSPSKASIRQRVQEGVDCFLHGYAK